MTAAKTSHAAGAPSVIISHSVTTVATPSTMRRIPGASENSTGAKARNSRPKVMVGRQ